MVRRAAALVLLAAIAAGCTSGSREEVPSTPPTETVGGGGGVLVPHLVGIGREEAETLLQNRGLFPKITPRGSGSDVVLAQDPAPDVRIPEHSLVVLEVDCSAAPCPMPPNGAEIYDPWSCAFR